MPKTIDEFVKDNLGKKIDWDNAFGGQCVDLFRQYVNDVLDLPQPVPAIGARMLWENYDLDKNLYTYYDRILNSLFAIPKKGDIPIWNEKAGGGYGHVAVVLEASLMSFKSFDQNWPTLDVCTITEHNYKNIYGWLRPKILVEDNVGPLVAKIKELENKIKELEGPAKFWKDALVLVDLPTNAKWGVYKAKIKEMQSLISDQKTKIEKLEKSLSGNVTALDAKKDGSFIYGSKDLINELLKRLGGGTR